MQSLPDGSDGSVRGEEVPGASGGTVVFPDEETFEVPSSWRRLVHPRRGGFPQPVPDLDPDAGQVAAKGLAEESRWLEEMLSSPDSDPEIVAATRAHLAGSPNPLGAAAVAAVSLRWDHRPGVLVDAWVLAHGLSFAARAVVEYIDIEAMWTQHGSVRSDSRLLRRPADGSADHYWARPRFADRMRALIAVSGDEEYEQVVSDLAGCRTGLRRRCAVSYLVPGEQHWVDECCAEADGAGATLRAMLLCSLGSPEQIEKFPRSVNLPWNGWDMELVATLAEGVGQAVAPLLTEALATAPGADRTRTVARALVALPTDDAFRVLLSHADDKHVRTSLVAAMDRYPVRALRLLAEAASAPGGQDRAAQSADRMLAHHVMTHRALVKAALPGLAPGVAAQVEPLLDEVDRVADAPAEALPALLVDPPWTRKRAKAPEKREAARIPTAPGPKAVWQPGEREKWSAMPAWLARRDFPAEQWTERLEKARGDRGWNHLAQCAHLFLHGPEDEARQAVRAYRPAGGFGNPDVLRPLAARFGTDVLHLVLEASADFSVKLGDLVLPFLSTEVAARIGDWLIRLKSANATARGWLGRHGLAAVPYLLPQAVGPTGPARNGAETALKVIAQKHGVDAVREAAATAGGPEAASIVAEILDGDPMAFALPKRMPAVGPWADPGLLPQILLKDGGALPVGAARHVLTMLALSKPHGVYPGIAVLKEHCTPASLAAFAWGLFEQWQFVGTPAKESWVLHALGLLGDDDTVRRLSPLLRAWPGEGSHKRAVDGLDVLAAIGSDVALMHLHGISQRVKFKGLKARAQEKIAEVADGLGLTGEQLGDRLVPDFGLDADGSTVIDYGTRRFTVGFDEQLRPYVKDADGTVRKALPAPGVKDDQTLAPTERKRFATLKKDVRTVASDQVRRLEQAMVTQRSWTDDEFRELFVDHPLMRHLVRRLVWTGETGGAVTTFRVAEDSTFADAEDELLTLPEGATVRLAHPLHLGGERDTWAELFADYEILQPFPQLGRPVHALTGEEAAGHRLARFEGATVPVGKLLGLTKRGWERGTPQDAGVECWISRPAGPGRYLVIDLDPGIAVGMVNELGDQTLEAVRIDSSPDYYRTGDDHPLRLGDLDPVLASELLADLTEVTAG
ncbi:DUF4132 domain-containing protein [Streptomyces sp. ML-6]|uniref:DUF4132 domain-containing protein n=1 Tax=Streptomyces sp. ML-6 TaxID=2982693 RepID=UPI0024BF34F0|nr:DUF4132 domain-containing protein [Streptomyces sp. ML-6]MDK0524405.1 DUF4132 domain-containing protein [Streptomyces sp. ML-6]